jgi:hypothetical protein
MSGPRSPPQAGRISDVRCDTDDDTRVGQIRDWPVANSLPLLRGHTTDIARR